MKDAYETFKVTEDVCWDGTIRFGKRVAEKLKELCEQCAEPCERSWIMKKYVCLVCGYVYDPAEGDPDSGIAAGTAFEDLPDDWVCPVCGASKDQFEEETG